jgi:type I restriction enzyme M protein
VTLDQFNLESKNKYCKAANLKNESDVEQFFIIPLLRELGYTDDYVRTKATIQEESMGKGRKRRTYSPDYICYSDRRKLRPVLVIDAKSPKESAEGGVEDAQLYTSYIRRGLDEPRPEQYCVGSNGVRTIVKHYDRDTSLYDLQFEQFNDGNPRFEAFKDDLNRTSRAKAFTSMAEPFEFKRYDDLNEIQKLFIASHNLIWRKEVSSPQFAFYEFAKLMFIKLNEDRRLRADPECKALMDAEKPLPREKVRFSVHWIVQNEEDEPNPINKILFIQLRDGLELEILRRKKKRIFEPKEEIELKADTIKGVVKLLEHSDLFGIDEDLNGRLFETFLGATMRGRALGQFFTPRTVVDFMTELANLQATDKHIDYVLDGCCGTGGFLISAMAEMTERIKENKYLSGAEKEKLLGEVRDSHLFGIDAGKNPPVARIARINMYLHGDGGSRVYFCDALDRDIMIEETLDPELKAERQELREVLLGKTGLKFDVILTNPPFAMPYKASDAEQKRVLRQYKEVAYTHGEKGTLRLKASLKSNVMFLVRYYDLLAEGGKLITVIDESVLNTDTDRDARDFIFRNYLIRAIISLPRMTFLRAGSNVKTSILYLEKREKGENEEQPFTFYGRCHNSGFDPKNLHKADPSKSDLPQVLEKFQEFQKSGKL